MRKFLLVSALLCHFALACAIYEEVDVAAPCFYYENLDLTVHKIISVLHDKDDVVTLDNGSVWKMPSNQGIYPWVGQEVGVGVFDVDSEEYLEGWKTCLFFWDTHYHEMGVIYFTL